MNARELISELEKLPKDAIIKVNESSTNFECFSWRGAYSYPATMLEDAEYTVEEALDNLAKVEGTEVTGWKGGDFVLSEDDNIFLVGSEGSVGLNVTVVAVEYNISNTVNLITETDQF